MAAHPEKYSSVISQKGAERDYVVAHFAAWSVAKAHTNLQAAIRTATGNAKKNLEEEFTKFKEFKKKFGEVMEGEESWTEYDPKREPDEVQNNDNDTPQQNNDNNNNNNINNNNLNNNNNNNNNNSNNGTVNTTDLGRIPLPPPIDLQEMILTPAQRRKLVNLIKERNSYTEAQARFGEFVIHKYTNIRDYVEKDPEMQQYRDSLENLPTETNVQGHPAVPGYEGRRPNLQPTGPSPVFFDADARSKEEMTRSNEAEAVTRYPVHVHVFGDQDDGYKRFKEVILPNGVVEVCTKIPYMVYRIVATLTTPNADIIGWAGYNPTLTDWAKELVARCHPRGNNTSNAQWCGLIRQLFEENMVRAQPLSVQQVVELINHDSSPASRNFSHEDRDKLINKFHLLCITKNFLLKKKFHQDIRDLSESFVAAAAIYCHRGENDIGPGTNLDTYKNKNNFATFNTITTQVAAKATQIKADQRFFPSCLTKYLYMNNSNNNNSTNNNNAINNVNNSNNSNNSNANNSNINNGSSQSSWRPQQPKMSQNQPTTFQIAYPQQSLPGHNEHVTAVLKKMKEGFKFNRLNDTNCTPCGQAGKNNFHRTDMCLRFMPNGTPIRLCERDDKVKSEAMNSLFPPGRKSFNA